MKKVLLASLCLVSMCAVNAQLYLNELYVRPSDDRQEFFELYNGGNVAENTDCYTLVTYYAEGGQKGFYVIDLPSMNVAPGGYYVASSANPFRFQDADYVPDYNYRTRTPGVGGTSTKYVQTGGGYTTTSSDFTNIFLKSDADGGSPSGGGPGLYVVLLYKNGVLVDGFLGAHNSTTLPNYVANMPDLTVNYSCGSFDIDFGSIDETKLANVNSSAGTDNGYYRKNDGPCPTRQNFEKSSSPSEHTPGTSNSGSNSPGNSGNITYTSSFNCTTGDLTITLESGPAVDIFAYRDNPVIGMLGVNDVLVDSEMDVTNGETVVLDINNEFAAVVIQSRSDCRAKRVAFFQCTSSTPLPVNLGSFNAKRNRGTVQLNWETLTELNNEGFYIQRKTAGNWENVQFIRSAASGGNSNGALSYSFNDPNNFKGVSQYRLQQVDVNGRAQYSVIKPVNGEGQAGGIRVYPNPTIDGAVNVVFDNTERKDIMVSDISGRVVKSWKGITENNLRITSLMPGTYMLQIRNEADGTTVHEKIIVNR